ncbi:MAG: hypothetical protein U0736_13060 [Gemmataceae bacterium]
MTSIRGHALACALLLAALAVPTVRAAEVPADPVCCHKKQASCYQPCNPCCPPVGPVRRFFRRVFHKDCCPQPVIVAPAVVAAPVVAPVCPPPIAVAPRPVVPAYPAPAAPPASIAAPEPPPMPAAPTAPFPSASSSYRRDPVPPQPAPPIRFERIASRAGESSAPVTTVRAKVDEPGYRVTLVHAANQQVRRTAQTSADGWFAADLTPGVWYVYYHGDRGSVYRGQLQVTQPQVVRVRL